MEQREARRQTHGRVNNINAHTPPGLPPVEFGLCTTLLPLRCGDAPCQKNEHPNGRRTARGTSSFRVPPLEEVPFQRGLLRSVAVVWSRITPRAKSVRFVGDSDWFPQFCFRNAQGCLPALPTADQGRWSGHPTLQPVWSQTISNLSCAPTQWRPQHAIPLPRHGPVHRMRAVE